MKNMRLFRRSSHHEEEPVSVGRLARDSDKPYDPTELGRQIVDNSTFYDNPKELRRQFHIGLIELADKFDSLDHHYGPTGGTEIQDDCMAVRELARSLTRSIAETPEYDFDATATDDTPVELVEGEVIRPTQPPALEA